MVNGRITPIIYGDELPYIQRRGIDIQDSMLANDIEKDKVDKARKFYSRLMELVRDEKYVDVELKMEAGRITIWYEKVKTKP